MTDISRYEKKRLQREQRLAEPLPADWCNWDTKAALRAARKNVEQVRNSLTRNSDEARQRLDVALECCDLIEKALDR